MSRIGRMPIPLPAEVEVTQEGRRLRVKGPLGQLERELHPEMQLERADGELRIVRPSDEPRHRALHGLTRTLVNNMVTGVTSGSTRPPASKSASRPPRGSACSAPTRRSSARPPPTSARSASPSRTRARASATRVSRSSARRARLARSAEPKEQDR